MLTLRSVNLSDSLKTMSQIVGYWLMANTNLDVEKIVDLEEFIKGLDEPVEFKLKDGTVVKTGDRSGDMVEIKTPWEYASEGDINHVSAEFPESIIRQWETDREWFNKLEFEPIEFIRNEKGDTIKKRDCKHEFIKMDNGTAMSLDDQATGEQCKWCGKWRNVKTLGDSV